MIILVSSFALLIQSGHLRIYKMISHFFWAFLCMHKHFRDFLWRAWTTFLLKSELKELFPDCMLEGVSPKICHNNTVVPRICFLLGIVLTHIWMLQTSKVLKHHLLKRWSNLPTQGHLVSSTWLLIPGSWSLNSCGSSGGVLSFSHMTFVK